MYPSEPSQCVRQEVFWGLLYLIYVDDIGDSIHRVNLIKYADTFRIVLRIIYLPYCPVVVILIPSRFGAMHVEAPCQLY